MRKTWKLRILIALITISLISCSSPLSNKNEAKTSGLCQSVPFDAGVQITLPLSPISILVDSNGVNFKIESKINIDLLIVQLEPYLTFDTPGNPLSSCLKVEIRNPQWESGYKRFYVNFNKDNVFRVRVKTDEYTEFVFSKERWIASPPGEQELVRYEYKTNTLHLDASNGRVEEFEILAEKPESEEKYSFCVNELQNRGDKYFVSPIQYIIAFIQDFINTTREAVFGKFGPLGGGLIIPIAWFTGSSLLLMPLRKMRESVSKKWLLGRFIFLIAWTCFWIVVFSALPVCWS